MPSEREWALCRVTWRRSYLSGAFVAIANDDPTDPIAASPRFRWRGGDGAPPQLPDIVASLDALSAELAAAGWEPDGVAPAEWCALRFRRPVVSLKHRLKPYDAPPDADMVSWLTEQATAASAPDDTIFGEETWRLASIRNAVSRNEAKRLEEARKEAERAESERLAAARLEAERLVAERLAVAQAEAERLLAEQRAIERLEADRRRELERIAAEEAPVERFEVAQVEAERVEPEQLEPEPPARSRSDAWALTSRLGAYSARDGSPNDIRTAFDRKRDGKVRRDHRR